MRDGSFSHFLISRREETGNQGRFLFPVFKENREKEPSLIPSFPRFCLEKSGKRNHPSFQHPPLLFHLKVGEK